MTIHRRFGARRAVRLSCELFSMLAIALSSAVVFPFTAAAGGAAAPAQRSAQAANTVDLSTLVTTPTGRISSGLNPAYLNNLPAVELVKKTIQGSDPTDTLVHQVAVFNTLSSRIQHHLANDRHAFSLSPDEVKVKYAYDLASYQIEQEYKKTHTPAEANAFVTRHNQYESDWAVEKEIDTKLLSAQAVAENRANDTGAFQQLKAHNDAIERQNEEAKARADAAAKAGPGRPSNDPTSVAIQRCLELGGDGLTCVGKGLGKGMMGMIGLDLDKLGPPGRTGLAIAGSYADPSGASLSFDEKVAQVFACGKLDVMPALNYSVTRRGTSLVLQMENQPRPFTLVLGPDGNMTGPGLVEVTGQVIVGYRRYTVVDHRVSDWQVVGQHEESQPIYAPKVDRCTFRSLKSGGPATSTKMDNLAPLLASVMSGKASPDLKTFPGGPRLNGTYQGAGGLTIEFAPEAAILDCRQAHVASTYTVQNAADAVHVNIDNRGAPIALTLQPDGSLVGSGTADIAGRLVSGQAPGAGVAFRPVRADCPVGTLAPRTAKSGLKAGM